MFWNRLACSKIWHACIWHSYFLLLKTSLKKKVSLKECPVIVQRRLWRYALQQKAWEKFWNSEMFMKFCIPSFLSSLWVCYMFGMSCYNIVEHKIYMKFWACSKLLQSNGNYNQCQDMCYNFCYECWCCIWCSPGEIKLKSHCKNCKCLSSSHWQNP